MPGVAVSSAADADASVAGEAGFASPIFPITLETPVPAPVSVPPPVVAPVAAGSTSPVLPGVPVSVASGTPVAGEAGTTSPVWPLSLEALAAAEGLLEQDPIPTVSENELSGVAVWFVQSA